jgi:ApbE superfamily uncharacterized protein (UPF0280 family)
MPAGPTAQRMYRATAPHTKTAFVTQMAAVAGAVADEMLATIASVGNIERAYVNNGGDIALYLAQGQVFRLAMAGLDNADLGRITISASQKIGGIATSGHGGRSLSLGIADAVTVLARNAASADAAATLIANAVDLPGHPAIRRRPASSIEETSDLGERLVPVSVGPLRRSEIEEALAPGLNAANGMVERGLITGAMLQLGQQRLATASDMMYPMLNDAA